jgi:hypothetical protein
MKKLQKLWSILLLVAAFTAQAQQATIIVGEDASPTSAAPSSIKL